MDKLIKEVEKFLKNVNNKEDCSNENVLYIYKTMDNIVEKLEDKANYRREYYHKNKDTILKNINSKNKNRTAEEQIAFNKYQKEYKEKNKEKLKQTRKAKYELKKQMINN